MQRVVSISTFAAVFAAVAVWSALVLANTIGAPLLAGHWTDPDFDPEQRAFYYVRVLEIPTPRWTAYDAKFFNVKMPDDTVMVLQDRAYTSPVWYTP